MRALLFLVLAACFLALGSAAVIPVHIPMNGYFESPAQYDVPHWLGVFSVSTPELSNWSLPATYQQGGQVYAGQFLVVRNFGPECIALNSYPEETVDGELSFLVGPAKSVTIVADYFNWVVVNQVDMETEPYCEIPPPPTTSSSSFSSGSGYTSTMLDEPPFYKGGHGRVRRV